MNKFKMVLLFVGFSLFSFAQNANISGNISTNNVQRLPFEERKLIGDTEVREGSPYLNGDDFKKVNIPGYSSNVPDLRYNAFSDEMEFLNGKDTYSANKENGQIIKFIDGKIYECLNYNLEGKDKFGYLVQLVHNPEKYSLYKREKVELLKGEKSPNGITKDRNDYYAKEKDIYIIRKNETFTKMAKNKKGFFSDLSLKSDEVEKFIKEKQINFKSEADLIKLVTYMNTL
ncbi:hypothetical protein DRF60_00255 [Chryseobacterium elymi]|uniref:Uncharacterized protein n=1 Tax=Chryseobacterium elymi TaxID=395936 RepID=A0A3D9DQ88_9FLAO|nr:hypothetical protein [Chryseobacterium elymi]REC80184.1 hypothetical protein DRF60_00255 [Chryseobacterium elymi]